jgi:probable addiction module antidote protein
MGSAMKAKFKRYDTANYLKTEKDIAAYLQAAMEDDDPQSLAVALGNVVRARNVSALARETGLTREGLYKAFSAQGNPSYATVSKVSRAMGFRLQLIPEIGGGLENHFLRPHDPHDSKYEVVTVDLADRNRTKRQAVRNAEVKSKSKGRIRGHATRPKVGKAANTRRMKT